MLLFSTSIASAASVAKLTWVFVFLFFTNWQLQEPQRDFTCNQPRGSQVWDTREKRTNLKNTLHINFYRQFQVIPMTIEPTQKRIDYFISIARVPLKDEAVSSHTHDNLTNPKKDQSFISIVCLPQKDKAVSSYTHDNWTNPKKDQSLHFHSVCALKGRGSFKSYPRQLNQPQKESVPSFQLHVCPKRTRQFQVIPMTIQPTPKRISHFFSIACEP